MAGNGAIAGLVAITAPSGYVELWAAPIIGAVAGVIVVLGVLAIDKKIDDPVGALSAHGLAGVWGTLACGLFAAPRLVEKNVVGDRGLFYSGSFDQLFAQALGVVSAFAFVFAVLVHHLLGDQEDLRPARRGRGRGRRTGHFRARHVRVSGAVHPGSGAGRVRAGRDAGHARAPAASPLGRFRHEEDRGVHPARGVRADPDGAPGAGVPVPDDLEVKGSGRQKGITERYRGAELTNWLRPKVKLECVVASGDVQTVVEAILKHARTGSIGDGKVFILPVEEAYRIRTGESGEETLQAHPGVAAQAASSGTLAIGGFAGRLTTAAPRSKEAY